MRTFTSLQWDCVATDGRWQRSLPPELGRLALGSIEPDDLGSVAVSTGERVVSYGRGRSALLDATVRVVARSGLRKLTNRAVAEEVGVTHGLVGHHFGSRDALIEAAIRHVLDLRSRRLAEERGASGDVAGRLFELLVGDPDTQAFEYELALEARRRLHLAPLIAESP